MHALKKLSYIFILWVLIISCRGQSSAYPDTILWKISGNGLEKPSYLFGTIHTKHDAVFNTNDSLLPKLQETGRLILELDFEGNYMQKIQDFIVWKDGTTLKDVYSKEEYHYIQKAIEENTNFSESQVQQIKPIGLAMLVMNQRMPKDKPYIIDEYLHQYAEQNEIQTAALETVDEQMDALMSTSNEQILEYFKNVEKHDKIYERLVEAYTKEDINSIETIIDESSEFYAKNIVITDRNHSMAERIDKQIQENPALVAVGVGHLPGKEGLLRLLSNKGYTLMPVKAPHNEPLPAIKQDIADWKLVEPQDIPFSVKMPEMPEKETQNIPFQDKSIKMNTYMYQNSGGKNLVYGLIYMDYADADPGINTENIEDDSRINKMFKSTRENILKQVQGELLDSKKVPYQQYPGREYTISMQDGNMLMYLRSYFIQHELVMMQVITHAEDHKNKMVQQYFDSFMAAHNK